MSKVPGWDTGDVLAGLILVAMLAGVVAMGMTIYSSLVDGEPLYAAAAVVLGVMFLRYVMQAYNEFRPLSRDAYRIVAVGVLTIMAVTVFWAIRWGYIQASYGVAGVLVVIAALEIGILYNPFQRRAGVTA